ncbi:hypothetical protein BG910_05785 [Neisseria chenwenguii]|uniref:Uncharacterized protein n=2 Tax=Neisseria chenwenguii TaxID=1853278 RepID=A0A220S5H8_9NEIS|nr:hypothetical protein BG910_05785 [Neisseria chenwenguii]ROV57073.1 hypothetical protein EGS38_02375 [Neisseria chenwenguii]
MKKFWKNYKKNLVILAGFHKNYWKAFAVICFGSAFITHAANFILSVFIINPKYFLGDDHFLPDGIVAILSTVLIFVMMWKYLKRKKELDLDD